ncbi:MAG: hypothetical protein M1282_17335 [Chloroflexi bacterium]|nr:hypothetical protein [Chloroflexota bacterium]
MKTNTANLNQACGRPAPIIFTAVISRFTAIFFFEAAGFVERFTRRGDVELGYRLAAKGAHFRFEPKAAAIHRPTRTLESWYRTPYLYGIRDVQMVRDKGVDQIMELAQRHFRQRNWITRALAHLVIGTPFLENAILGLGKSGIRAFNRFGPRRLGLMLCSFVFNLRYLQGMSEEMGGRTELWRAIGRKTNDIKSEALL